MTKKKTIKKKIEPEAEEPKPKALTKTQVAKLFPDDKLKPWMDTFFSSLVAAHASDDMTWCCISQYALFKVSDEKEDIELGEKMMNDSMAVFRDVYRCVSKYLSGEATNALMYALEYIRGLIYAANEPNEDMQKLIACAREFKRLQEEGPNKGFDRSDLGYG